MKLATNDYKFVQLLEVTGHSLNPEIGTTGLQSFLGRAG